MSSCAARSALTDLRILNDRLRTRPTARTKLSSSTLNDEDPRSRSSIAPSRSSVVLATLNSPMPAMSATSDDSRASLMSNSPGRRSRSSPHELSTASRPHIATTSASSTSARRETALSMSTSISGSPRTAINSVRSGSGEVSVMQPSSRLRGRWRRLCHLRQVGTGTVNLSGSSLQIRQRWSRRWILGVAPITAGPTLSPTFTTTLAPATGAQLTTNAQR